MCAQVIVVGGGLSGLSAAHTVLERGGKVVVIDKNSFMGGNSTKATSGINGALTRTQQKLGINDSAEIFYEDTAKSARDRLQPGLARVLTYESASAVEWLQDKFKLDLSLVSRLGGHSFPRTHRGKEKFPGMTITYALMERLEELSQSNPQDVRIILKGRVVKLLKENNEVIGVEYEKDGKKFTEYGAVVIATGGYGADFGSDSLLSKHRPDLIKKNLATTNGNHCTGDGIKIAQEVGAGLTDIEMVQVHPTGLVDVKDPDAKVKFLAAEALRGVGGLLLNSEGNRFCNELGHRDYVTGEMWKNNKAPYRLVLNGAGSKEIEWHCKHYTGRGLMKYFATGEELAKEMGISPKKLEQVFEEYNKIGNSINEAEKKGTSPTNPDPFGKKFFQNLPFKLNDHFYVAIVTPVIHYCMGGLSVSPDSEVTDPQGKPIPGLYAAGEVMGGTHGANRLGGSSLLDCVVFGRVAGNSASKHLFKKLSSSPSSASSASSSSSSAPSSRTVAATRRVANLAGQTQNLRVTVSWGN